MDATRALLISSPLVAAGAAAAGVAAAARATQGSAGSDHKIAAASGKIKKGRDDKNAHLVCFATMKIKKDTA